MTEELIHRDIGRMSAEISQTKADIISLKTDLHEMNKTITEIRDLISQTKGGWKVLVTLAAVVASISGLVVALIGGFIK